MQPNVAIPNDQIADFCRAHHIRRLSLFGSVLRDDFQNESDVDVLIEFEPDHKVDFFTFIDLQDELSEILGREVDLNTPGFLSRYFRQKIMDTAQVIYERTG